MPFGKNTKEDVAEAVKDMFGMTADEVKAKLAKIDSVEGTLADVKTLATSQSGTMTEIKEALGKISTPYSRPAEQQQQQENKTNEPRRWDEDADGAFADRSQPIIDALLDTKAAIARREAMDEINAKNPDIPWTKISKEIDEKAKGSTLQQMASPIFWKNVYHVVVGENRQEIERDKNQKSGRFYTETASSSIVVDADDKKKPEDKLTQEQVNAARKAGISPADYAKELDTMQVWR